MVRFIVRYNGKVLVPEDTVDLPTDVPLRVTVHTDGPLEAEDTVLALEGLGAEVWHDIDALQYQRDERRGWA